MTAQAVCKHCVDLAKQAADTMASALYTSAIHALMSHYGLDHAEGYKDSHDALQAELQGFARAGWSDDKLSEYASERLERIFNEVEAG